MTHSTLNLETATGHQVMAAAGKKILRPGGRVATEQLFAWADFQPGETVLELAASFGYSAIALAKRYGVRVIGVEKNPASVARAQANIQAAGLADRVQVIEGDVFHLEQIVGQNIPAQFDYVLAEAILTMQSVPAKAKILAGIFDRLKPNGKFLSHELLVRDRATEIRQALASTIRVNSTPLPEAEWLALCETAKLQVVQHQTGAMGLLSPLQVIRDEGTVGALKFCWNVLTRPPVRQRILAMRRIFQRYHRELGYITLCATRSA